MRRLTPDAVDALLAQLQPVLNDIVLIGGQALNLWVERDASSCAELSELAPLTSKDIDFFGTAAQAELCAQLLGGTCQQFGPGELTVAAGVVTTPDGVEIDLVHTPRGVSPDEIATRAIQLASVRVMHPIHVLMSRAANVVHIPRTDQHSLKQLRAAVFVVREFVRETLRETAVRPALRPNEWAFEAAMSDDSLCVWRAYGVDFFDAVLIASELGEDFAKIRFPQMSARLLARRNA